MKAVYTLDLRRMAPGRPGDGPHRTMMKPEEVEVMLHLCTLGWLGFDANLDEQVQSAVRLRVRQLRPHPLGQRGGAIFSGAAGRVAAAGRQGNPSGALPRDLRAAVAPPRQFKQRGLRDALIECEVIRLLNAVDRSSAIGPP